MEREQNNSTGSDVIDWVCTLLAVLAFFLYVLVIAFAPGLFRQPISSGTLVSIGIASGVALTVFLVALAGIYTWLRNRSAGR